MAYEFEILDVVRASVDGKEFWTYRIRETDVDIAGSEWEIPGNRMPPTPCVLSLYEAEITDAGASGATTLQPAVGIGAAFPTSGLRHIASTAAAAATIRTETNKKIPGLARTPGNRFRGRSTPDADGVPVITSRITFRLGD